MEMSQKAVHTQFEFLDILVDSEIMLANREKKRDRYEVVKIYKRRNVLPVISEQLGNWSLEQGFRLVRNPEITSRQRKDLMGTELKTCMVITHNDSLNHLTDKR